MGNFPSTLVDCIRYHHAPEDAPEESSSLVYVVNFADALCHYQDFEIDYYQFDSATLQRFNITSEVQLSKISEKLKAAFKDSQM